MLIFSHSLHKFSFPLNLCAYWFLFCGESTQPFAKWSRTMWSVLCGRSRVFGCLTETSVPFDLCFPCPQRPEFDCYGSRTGQCLPSASGVVHLAQCLMVLNCCNWKVSFLFSGWEIYHHMFSPLSGAISENWDHFFLCAVVTSVVTNVGVQVSCQDCDFI